MTSPTHLPAGLGTGVWQRVAVQGLTEGLHELNDTLCWCIQQGTLHQWHLHPLDECQPETLHAPRLAHDRQADHDAWSGRSTGRQKGSPKTEGPNLIPVPFHTAMPVTNVSSACSAVAAVLGVSGWNL